MERTHLGQHGDACFGCRIQSVTFAPSCFPTTPGGRKALQVRQGDKALSKDLDAFKRLAEGGNMPKRIEGSARTEQLAEVPYEIESGQIARTRAKGPDVDRKGKEWGRRAQDAHDAVKRGEVVATH